MKEILVVSGKGGTGKTTVVASFAYFWGPSLVLADADVDASNLPLLLNPTVVSEEPFRAGSRPERDDEKCSACGLCREKCRFKAVGEDLSFDLLSCEGCGVCAWFCPEGAITMREKEAGRLFLSETTYGSLVHAALYPGEENSGKLVSLVKRRARERAEAEGKPLILVDGAPGVGCPVISSFSGADLALIVAEPTVSGLHDLERLVSLLRHFRLPGRLVLNKADLSAEQAEELVRFAEGEGIPFLGSIPYDEEVFDAIRQGRPLPAVSTGPAARALAEISFRLQETLRREE